MANECSCGALAQLLLLRSDRRVQQLAKEGIVFKTGRGKYDLVKSVQGYIKYQSNLIQGNGNLGLTDERIRLTKINADQKLLDYKKAKGELINVDVAMKLWGGVVMLMKTKLLSIPTKLAPMVAMCKGLPEVKAQLDEHIDEVLHELASPDIKKIARMEFDKRNTSNVPTTTTAKRKRVGGQKKKVKSRVKRGTRAVSNVKN